MSFISHGPPGAANAARRRRAMSSRGCRARTRERPNTARSIVLAKLRPAVELASSAQRLFVRRESPQMLLNPTIASTAPLAGIRSPRRASGLNSGSSLDAELDEELELLALRAPPSRCAARSSTPARARRGSAAAARAAAARRRRARGLRARRASGASSRRCSRGRRRTSQPRCGSSVKRSGRHHSSSCVATHSTWRGVMLPGSACWRNSATRYSRSIVVGRRAGREQQRLALELQRAGAREHRVELRPLRRNPRLAAIEPDLCVRPRWTICRAMSSGSSVCHRLWWPWSVISRANAA